MFSHTACRTSRRVRVYQISTFADLFKLGRRKYGGGGGRRADSVHHMDSAALPALLRRGGLERLHPRFEEEDLTVPLLISMGTQLRANLADMALSPDEIEAVAEALLHRADDGADPSANEAGSSGCCSGLVLEAGGATSCGGSHQQATVSPDPLASFRQAVAEL